MKNISYLLLATLIVSLTTAELIPFGQKAVDAIFKQKKNALILFIDSDEQGQKAQSTFTEIAENSNNAIAYTLLQKQANAEHFRRFSEYLGFTTVPTPFLVYLVGARQKYVLESPEISAEVLDKFVAQVTAGELKPFFKSAPISEDNGDAVKTLVGKNYKEIIYGDEREYLVKIYAPWCGHCKQIAPEFKAAAQALRGNPNIVLADFDGTLNQVQGVQIQGYPTLYFYSRDKSVEPIKFNGERNKEGIIDWLKDHTEHEWVQPVQVAEVQPGEQL